MGPLLFVRSPTGRQDTQPLCDSTNCSMRLLTSSSFSAASRPLRKVGSSIACCLLLRTLQRIFVSKVCESTDTRCRVHRIRFHSKPAAPKLLRRGSSCVAPREWIEDQVGFVRAKIDKKLGQSNRHTSRVRD